MREPGADCPECSAPLFRGRCTACGWTAKAAERSVVKACADCGETFQFWTSLTPGEDGVRRCATCHVAYLKRRAEAGRICTEPGCSKTAEEHRAEFFALSQQLVEKMTTVQESWRTTPSLLERRGDHAVRPSVKRAYGIAENAPDPTPAEWDEHERRKAEALRWLRAMDSA